MERDLKYELNLLKQRQKMPLSLKERYTAKRITDWYDFWGGEVYVSFSGGKDSTVLLHQVRRLYKNIPGVFVDTGLEYPEIRQFVKTIDNIIWLKPKMRFNKVLCTYGYPVVSKKVARFIRDLQNARETNTNVCNLRLTGFNQKGIFCPSQKLPEKWKYLINAPFKISEQCCDIMKKEPFHRYVKETGRKGITAVMASESLMRERQYIQQGCNAYFSRTNKISMPMAFWTEEDIWGYIKKYNLQYASIYDKGESRTGCIFCMFGVHLESKTNRFQRLQRTHPKLWSYCIHTLNLKQCLDYLNIDYLFRNQFVIPKNHYEINAKRAEKSDILKA